MINKFKIQKELKEQINNFKKINKTEKAEELLDSIHGTEQRSAILSNTDEEELYNMYISEIESTSSLIFPEGSSEKAKVLNALEYMRITANRESETIDGIDNLGISGINSAILGEGNESSQNSYFRDLLNYADIDASIIPTSYLNENGKKSLKELVQVQLSDGQSVMLSPTEYNGCNFSIEKFNNGDYTEKTLIPKRTSSQNLEFSDNDIIKSNTFINSQLIDKYKIK